jgi:ribonuclease E
MSEAEVAGGTEAPEPAPEAPVSPDAAPDVASSPAVAATAAVSPVPASTAVSGDGSSSGEGAARKRRRRGSRGGRKRSKPRADVEAGGLDPADRADAGGRDTAAVTLSAGAGDQREAGEQPPQSAAADDRNPDLPDRHSEGRPASIEAAAAALVPKMPPPGAPPKPKIGDTIPADALRSTEAGHADEAAGGDGGKRRRRRRGGRGRSSGGGAKSSGNGATRSDASTASMSTAAVSTASRPIEAVIAHDPVELDEETLDRRRGRERKGRPVGRYMMCVHVTAGATQIAVLEGRSLIEHYVSHPSDDVSQIHGNVYLGRVQNVLPGMEAAFVDIGTPKNAVLYRGDVHYDPEDVESGASGRPRIEDVLRAGQTILCQVTKNPIGAKGARLTQEVSLPGRFVVLIPNSSTYGISKRLPDDERKRLRTILDRVKPAQHGVIVRTAAENVTTEEIEDDVRRLLSQWHQIEGLGNRSKAPSLLYREPDMAVRVIREEFSQEYRSVLIDDRELFTAVRDYVASISPELAARVELYDVEAEALPLFERHHVHEQLHRALDRKVWLPSGGSLIIEHTEALTVIDVNTGKNVGRSSLEETVFKNNLEASVEIARQLRLRDVGGIIVVDFIDMERKDNRDEVVRVFRDALSRDKTRTQVFEISELGLCEMTRKRIGEGLLESFARRCPDCEGRGVLVDRELLPD